MIRVVFTEQVRNLDKEKKGKFTIFKTKYNRLKLSFVIIYWKWLIITNTF